MDNASFHHTDRIKELCSNAGVKLLYSPPYSSDLNPIEEFFAELKAVVRRKWQKHPGQDFKEFPEWSLDIVGSRNDSAQGYFRHVGIEVEEESL
jgi:transposase